jgi:photosystem II stability/assembly factor-like uncharacterized protein
MRRKPFIYLSITLLVLTGCRKDLVHWQQVEKVETYTATDRLNKIFFINDSVGFVVGGERFDKSTILKTTDGGKTWTYKNLNEAPKSLYSITRSPDQTLYAIGFDGKVLRSDNEGNVWKFHQIWYAPYKDIAFTQSNRGIIVGGVSFNQGIMTFIDSNANASPFDSSGYELNDIEMIDGKTGYVSGLGLILKTTDSGYSWQMQNIQDDNFKAVKAYGPDEAWTCGYNGSIFHTTNGGQSWERMRNGNNITKPSYKLLDIVFTDPLHGYAIGEEGVFIYSDDGGEHWMELDKFTDAALRCIIARKDGTLMVCGDDGGLYRVRPMTGF